MSRYDLDLWHIFLNLHRVWCIFLIFLEVVIPNLVCECFCDRLSVAKHFWVAVILTFDLVLEYLCPEHIFYIIWGEHPKISVWMHMWMAKYQVPFPGQCDLDLWLSFKKNHVQSISFLFFEVGIPNLMFESILGWQSAAYHTWASKTLTFDLVSWIRIESGAYLLYFLR